MYMPAQYRNDPQEMVRPATECSEFTEPVYEEVEERVMARPAWKKVTVVLAEYGQVEEKVLVRGLQARDRDPGAATRISRRRSRSLRARCSRAAAPSRKSTPTPVIPVLWSEEGRCGARRGA